jgi:hypothetical protein
VAEFCEAPTLVIVETQPLSRKTDLQHSVASRRSERDETGDLGNSRFPGVFTIYLWAALGRKRLFGGESYQVFVESCLSANWLGFPLLQLFGEATPIVTDGPNPRIRA